MLSRTSLPERFQLRRCRSRGTARLVSVSSDVSFGILAGRPHPTNIIRKVLEEAGVEALWSFTVLEA